MGSILFLLIVIILVLWILASCIRIVPQAYAIVLERLGAYQATWGTGVHFKLPFVERVARKVNLKEQVVDFPPQPVITKDNVTMQIDTVVFFQITDPKLYAYGVENPIMAIENLSATTLRNIIGDMELDETLTSREVINTKMRASLDVATDPWGIKVNRVELKNIIPPAAIQEAMEKQMKAERERREAILIAEGEKKSTILVAEGKKESAILDAEAEKQAAILRAEAQKERMIKEAEGQAEAVLKVQKANAEGLRMIKEAGADNAVLTLKSFEALAKVADGKSTKIIIPSEIQNLAGLAASLKEVVVDEKDKTILGNPNPDFTYGFQTRIAWKDLSVSASFNGVHGNQILNTNIRYYTPSRQAGNLTQEAFRNIWTEENHSNLYPSATANVKNVVYDRYIEDGSYLRCSDITLNYTLPKSWMKKIGFQNIGVFASVKNAFVITNYSGYDPEINSFAFDGLRPGIDMNAFPSQRSYVFGLNVAF